jgi:tRNA dimethylallyltransferase
MFDNGLVEEVTRILALGYPADAKPFESHGYKQALQSIRGELNRREAIFYAQRNTRQYAKRQLTWFRRETGLIWLPGFADTAGLSAKALDLVSRFLTNSA